MSGIRSRKCLVPECQHKTEFGGKPHKLFETRSKAAMNLWTARIKDSFPGLTLPTLRLYVCECHFDESAVWHDARGNVHLKATGCPTIFNKPEPEADPKQEAPVSNVATQPLRPQSDRDRGPSMQSLSLMIASYKGKNSNKLSDRMDQSDARHESQIKHLQLQLNSSKDRVCDLTTKLFAKTEMLAALEGTLSNMNRRLQQLALINHQKDMEINRLKAAAEVMQAYRIELERQGDTRTSGTNDVLASPVRRLWLKSPFGKNLKGKMLMSPKKTSPLMDLEGSRENTSSDSIKSSNQSPSVASVNELAEKMRQTDSQLEKTRLEAISSAFHLENAKELVENLTEEIVLLRKQNQQLELEEKKRQPPLMTSNAFNHFLYC